jgi:hypothetical protein
MMANEAKVHYAQHDIVCPRCQTPQIVHIQHIPGGSSPPLETVTCVKCKREFDMPLAGRIVGGPWLVG